jgi:hypothetical protein
MSDLIAPPMTDNEALRRILANVECITQVLTEPYNDVVGLGGLKAVNDSVGVTRGKVSNAVKTVVTNVGANPVWVWENGQLIGIVAPNGSLRSFGGGQGVILVKTAPSSGLTSTVAVTTYTH